VSLTYALAAADTELWAAHGPRHVHVWYVSDYADHIYDTCPGLRRGLHGRSPRRGCGALYPEAGDVCGWCLRVWRARQP